MASLCRFLVRHQPAADLSMRLGGNNRLCARTLIAAPNAIYVQRGAGPQPLERAEPCFACQSVHVNRRPIGSIIERQFGELAPLLVRKGAYVVVEAGDAHAAARVFQPGEDFSQRICRISYSAAK